MNVTVGRIVHYKLSDYDAVAINQRRDDAQAFATLVNRHARDTGTQIAAGEPGRTGHVEHVGNRVSGGEVYPAMVVHTFGETTANLQVSLDGNDTYWATSRQEGDNEGYWSWPPRATGLLAAGRQDVT